MDKTFENELYANNLKSLSIVAERVNLDPNVFSRIQRPKRALVVSVPVRMDDYTVKVFTGFRVQHNQSLGPFKGGIRYHPNVTLGEVAALAMLMTLKNSLLNLPLGGAKGGIAVDPTQLSRTEKQNMTRRYTSEISMLIGPEKDIPAPDVGTDAQTMAWIMDTFSQEYGYAVPGVVTGKPLEIGGSLGREHATGLGAIYCMERAAQKLGYNIDSHFTVAVQGFGNVGSNAALFAHKLGAKVVAISDVHGGIHSDKGLDIPALIEHYKENKTLRGFGSADEITNDNLLELKVACLIPSALEGAITDKNAGNVKAKLIVEGANGPVTQEATDILVSNGTVIIPDVLANGGGVIVSYFEWVQDMGSYFWSEDEVHSRLRSVINTAFDKVWDFANQHKMNMREAALASALKRLEKAMLLRGLYPR